MPTKQNQLPTDHWHYQPTTQHQTNHQSLTFPTNNPKTHQINHSYYQQTTQQTATYQPLTLLSNQNHPLTNHSHYQPTTQYGSTHQPLALQTDNPTANHPQTIQFTKHQPNHLQPLPLPTTHTTPNCLTGISSRLIVSQPTSLHEMTAGGIWSPYPNGLSIIFDQTTLSWLSGFCVRLSIY